MISVLVVCLAALADGTPILGGTTVENSSKYPYLVYIDIVEILRETKDYVEMNYRTCGGVIITLDVVLTAAHCLLSSITEPTITVKAGAIDRTLENGAQVVFAMDYKIHKNYLDTKFLNIVTFHQNDIALLWIKPSLYLCLQVQTAKLADSNFQVDNRLGMIAGWGVTSTGYEPDLLQEGEVRVISNRNCAKVHKPMFMVQSMMCILSDTKETIQCVGDSGGPLVIDGVVVGIASLARSAEMVRADDETVAICDPNEPAIFTRVSKYLSWINRNVFKGPPKMRKPRESEGSCAKLV